MPQTATSAVEPQWLRPEQAGEYLGVSSASLYRATRRGELPFFKVGGARVYRRSDLDSLPQRGPTREVRN